MSKDQPHSFSINVALNGLFLFRTEENNAVVRNQVLEEITKRFPAKEGFEVSIVDWPTREGAYTIIHTPMPEMTPKQKKRLREYQNAFKDLICAKNMQGATLYILYHAGSKLIEDNFGDVKPWAKQWLDKWETDERRSR